MKGNVLVILICLLAFGCVRERPKSVGHEGHRDLEAVAIRIHNRTNVEFLVQTFVRQRQKGYPIEKPILLPSTEQRGEFEQRPEIDLPLFSEVPISLERIGGYSLEFVSEKLETRLAVIDISKKEMDDAKERRALVITLEEKGLTILVGKKSWSQPWLRALPKRRGTDPSFAPGNVQKESDDSEPSQFTKSPSTFLGSE